MLKFLHRESKTIILSLFLVVFVQPLASMVAPGFQEV